MLYSIPTKRGMGVEIWGTFDDLSTFYEVIGKFWNDQNKYSILGYENRDKLISGFSYEIRKAFEGSRKKRKNSHYSFEEVQHFGTSISWVHFLFSMTAIKCNMKLSSISKFDVSMMLQIEFWLEKSMKDYDEIGANNLIGYIDGGLYEGNEFIYHYMRSINLDYFLLGGGKKSFRQLSNLLKRGVYITKEYTDYKTFLVEDAKRLNCEINNMEISDDHIDYENLIW